MILVNGNPEDTISPLDRGLTYGDGLFETIAWIEGKPLLWPLHIERLRTGCQTLHIPFPGQDSLLSDVDKLKVQDGKAVIKIIITRGKGGRGYAYTPDLIPTRIVNQSPWPVYTGYPSANGVMARICDLYLSSQPHLAGLKHLNRLEQVVARAEWSESGIAEGLMLDQNQNIIEGTMSNLFAVVGDELHTPKLDSCGIRGVQRQNVIEIAHEAGIPVHETDLHISRLGEFSEVFLTNSIIGIWPIVVLDKHTYRIGPITRKLQQLLAHPQ